MAEKMSVEKIYQKKSQLEHILLRPDTYIGSVEPLTQEMWIWNFETEKMIKKEITFVPGLYKIYDEILVNAADNKQRDANMSLIRVNIDKDLNTIKVYNNGKGIPVVEHKEEKVLVPTLIFGHLLTSSNYNDDEKKVTGGRNGYGAKLCNIFSKKFTLETSSREYKKSFKQTWSNNMSKVDEPIVKEAKDEDFTCITFQPDLVRLKMDKLDDDTIALLARRAYDIAASSPGVKVYLNDKRLPISKFEDYCKLYLSEELDDCGNPVKIVYDKQNPRWEIAIACSEIGFQQVSFVNSIATTKGGRHVDHVCDQLVKSLGELVNKKNKNGNPIKPFQIKNYMWLFVNCLIENPTFDSQTKENMTLQAKSFGSKCQLSEDFLKRMSKCGIVEKIMNWLAFKEKTDLEKTGSKSKQSKIKGIPKLDDANDAGTKDSMNCTLILTEGDSAKTLAVAGLGVIGRDKYGVFPLRGKMLNVREASTKQILENAEVTSLCKIIGLNFKEKYETRDSLKQLRYGRLMIMTDQDHDGSHIKGLIINFVHHKWPNLLKHGFVEEFITPIVKVSKSNNEKSFYSMPEFEEWQNSQENWASWKIKYYKGLGTSTSKEAKEYFSDMNRHRIKFEYGSARDDIAIQLAFSKKLIEERKDWLTKFMEDRKIRRENHLPDHYLYQKDTQQINYTDFINKEFVLFSNLDNERSIPSLVDGLKPGQRKVLFTCFKRNLVKEIKVAQLAGSVGELSAYHHGEVSLMSTIINLSQNFVGSNNINLLMPIGQFGTRLHGGKDAASARYIFTCLSPLTRLIFNPKDDPLFTYLSDDGFKVEPEYYCPIMPTVLINGAEGIGTGWSTKIPNYNPKDIIKNLRKMIKNEEPVYMKPFYKNFRGAIDRLDDTKVMTSGEISIIGENTIEITELPIGVWTQAYKENILEAFLHGQEKIPQCITDYREYHTDTTVRFVVKFTPEQFAHARNEGFHKLFKIQKTLSLNSMVLFDHNGCLRRYETVADILKEFFTVRLKYYEKRKAYLDGMLTAESLKLDNIARFIMEKIEGVIKVENLKKADIIKMLKTRKYDADPIAKWKERISNESTFEADAVAQEDEESENNENKDKHDYDYLLSMPIWNLTMEKKDEILKQQKAKGDELKLLREKSPQKLWTDDLDQFEVELEKVEVKEKEEESVTQAKTFKGGSSKMTQKQIREAATKKTGKAAEYLPDPNGDRIEPLIDPQIVAKLEKEANVKKEKKDDKELNIVDLMNGVNVNNLAESEIADIADRLTKPQKKEPTTKVAAVKGIKKEKSIKTELSKDVDDDNDDEILIDEANDGEAKTSKKISNGDKPQSSLLKIKPKTEKLDPKKPATARKKPTSKKDQPTLNNFFKPKKTDDSTESDNSSIEEIELQANRLGDVESAGTRSTRTKKPISYKLDEDDDSKDTDKNSSDYKIDDSDEDNVSKPKKKNISDDDDDDDDDKENKKKSPSKKKDDTNKTKKNETKPVEKKTAAKSKSMFKKATSVHSDDDDVKLDDSTSHDFVKSKSKPKKKLLEKQNSNSKLGTEAKKSHKTKKTTRYDDENDDDDDFVVDLSEEENVKPKSKKKYTEDDSSSSDIDIKKTKRQKKNTIDEELYAIDD